MKNLSQGDDALVPKLKYEHVHLTSCSKMWVDLATKVKIICAVSMDYMKVYVISS